MSTTNFSFPTAIRFGAGARKQVAETLLAAGCKRPLIVTDKALAALPVLAEFKTHLGGLDVAVFSGVFGNPTCSQVMDGAAAYKAHKADCVIGFGGGAAPSMTWLQVGLPKTPENTATSRPARWVLNSASTGSAPSALSVTISGRFQPAASRVSATCLRAPAPKRMAVGKEKLVVLMGMVSC